MCFFLTIQSVLTAIGMFADAINNEDLFGMMIMGWLLSLIACPGASAALRPNDCYVTETPFPKNRILLFILMFILGVLTVFPGEIIETFLELLLL